MRLLRYLPALLALAIPTVAQDEDQKDRPAFLGIAAVPVSAEIRAHYGLGKDVSGVLIVELVKKSSAARAGFRPGDIVAKFAGKPVLTFEELVKAIQTRKVGAKVAYVLRRGSGSITGTIVLGPRITNYEVERLAPPGAAKPKPMPTDVRDVPAPAPPRPKIKKAGKRPNVDKRLDKAEAELRDLMRKAKARNSTPKKRTDGDETASKKRAGSGLERWIKREERLVRAARKAGAERKIAYHEARLSVLKEMRNAGVRLPARRADRLEKKLDQILRMLRRRD